MKDALAESIFIYKELLNSRQQEKIDIFLEEINSKQEKYDTEILWIIDQEIGGIGGYCMPSDPIQNQFPEGINRELFRPLQYVRSEIDICDIRLQPRHVIHFSGMHLEAVLRMFLENKNKLEILKRNRMTLGKAAYKIKKMNVIDEVTIEALFNFIKLFNMAKHEININEDRLRLFSYSDAIICYICARIIGQEILANLRYPLSLMYYERDVSVQVTII